MRYKIKKGLIIEKVNKKTVIFDTSNSTLNSFNKTASEIFEMLRKNLTEEEIINKIANKYSIKKERAEKDLKNLILDLKKKKILF